MLKSELIEACMRKLGYDHENPQECLNRWCSEQAPEVTPPSDLRTLTQVCQWLSENIEGPLPFTYHEIHLSPAVAQVDSDHPPYGEDG